jgi:hypothetical protein
MRSLVLPVFFLSACFSGFQPKVSTSGNVASTSQASTSCTELCDDDCASVKTASAQEACVSACLASCTSDKQSCPRPDVQTSCGAKSCTVAKAALCDPCSKDDECVGTGSLCVGADASTNTQGHCGQKCVVDCDCPTTYECRGVVDPKTGHYDATLGRQCTPESKQCPQCKIDSDCPSENICEAGKCVAACVDDTSCPAGQRCFEDGRCGVACCFDKDCGDATLVCTNGRCSAK